MNKNKTRKTVTRQSNVRLNRAMRRQAQGASHKQSKVIEHIETATKVMEFIKLVIETVLALAGFVAVVAHWIAPLF